MLRGWIRQRNLTTAQLAERTGLERARVKQVLAGSDPMKLDEFLLLTQAVDVGPEDLGLVPGAEPPQEPAPGAKAASGPRLVVAPSVAEPIPLRPVAAAPTAEGFAPPDALGNLPKQVIQLGFALGVDLFLILDARQLQTSNIPQAVLSRFPEALPLRLEARFHAHNRPRYHDDRFECVLSFDALYTCSFPWAAFREVRFLLPEEAPRPASPTPPPEEAPPEPPRGGPRLRVVK